MRDKPWHKDASNQLVVNSILATATTVLLAAQLTMDATKNPCPGWIFLGALALFLFILDTEKLAQSFAEDDFETYRWSHIIYNIAVLLIFIYVAALATSYAEPALFSFHTWLVVAVPALAWVWWWGRDTWFLLRPYTERYKGWKAGLEGEEYPAMTITPENRARFEEMGFQRVLSDMLRGFEGAEIARGPVRQQALEWITEQDEKQRWRAACRDWLLVILAAVAAVGAVISAIGAIAAWLRI